MAYFDSPKNRAIWERELKGLRAEKERRAKEVYRPQKGEQEISVESRQEQNPFRKRITLKELEQAEREAVQARRARRPQRVREAEAKEPKRQSSIEQEKSFGLGGKQL